MYRRSFKQYDMIVPYPTDNFIRQNVSAFSTSNGNDMSTMTNEQKVYIVKLEDSQIIAYLEDRVEQLEKVLNRLKQYCGSEYIEASIELEEFLKKNKIR